MITWQNVNKDNIPIKDINECICCHSQNITKSNTKVKCNDCNAVYSDDGKNRYILHRFELSKDKDRKVEWTV